MSPNCLERNTSTVAIQSLHLLNNAMVESLAGFLAQRIRKETGDDPRRQIESGYWLALSRPPSAEEVNLSLAAWGRFKDIEAKKEPQAANQRALAAFCHALVNSAALLSMMEKAWSGSGRGVCFRIRPVVRRHRLTVLRGDRIPAALSTATAANRYARWPSPALRSDATPAAFCPKAKRVIHLFMNGGPFQLTFRSQTGLKICGGNDLGSRPRPNGNSGKDCSHRRSTFKQYGKAGHVERIASRTWPSRIDDICVIRSMYTDIPNHEPRLLMMNSAIAPVRPSMGSWVTYGLGTENQNLPGFVVLCPGGPVRFGTQNWQQRFLAGDLSGHVHRPREHWTRRIIRGFLHNTFAIAHAAAEHDSATRSNRSPDERPNGARSLDARINRMNWPFECRLRPATRSTWPGNARDPRDVWHRQIRPILRAAMPDGAPAGRARRSLRAALHGNGQPGTTTDHREQHAAHASSARDQTHCRRC